MAMTPKKEVHWNFDNISFSDLSSPSGSSDSYVSTSSLEYANAQLVAHGFVDAYGLCLDGTSNEDSERVVKCLLGLLSQRIEDMSRTEQLTTKFRTLAYDHERLTSMHRLAVEKAANAEREANLHKSKLAAAMRSLQSAENAHKQTTAELQRTRTSLQAIRSTHQAELKKREKEVERLIEKWQKIAELQSKMSTSPSGMQCANVAAVEGRSGVGASFIDVALEEAERARAALLEENNYLKALVLKAVNSIQRILYQTNTLLSSHTGEEITPYTLSTLFPISPPSHPADRLSLLLSGLRSSLETVSERLVNPPLAIKTPDVKETQNSKALNGEITRLQTIIENLQKELDRCHKQLDEQTQEIRTMFEKFAEEKRNSEKEIRKSNIELMSGPLRDEEKERLENIRHGLDQERHKLTDAAVIFGKEKSALELERSKFLVEKRSWEMLSELPPTPNPPPSPARPTKAHKQSPRKVAFKSPGPKKSPARSKAARASQRVTLGSSKKVIPAGETEILPPMPALTFSRLGTLPPAMSLLSTAFTLPPPSPHASLPSKPALPPPAPISPPDLSKSDPTSPDSDPTTPPAARKPFPVAKPFALRMVHAYSPAKPSPLSRILMLSDTPEGGTLNLGGDLSADSYNDTPPKAAPPEAPMSLAAELGVSESPPDTPLQEKKLVPNLEVAKPVAIKGRVLFPESRKATLTSKDKGKTKAEPIATTSTRLARVAVGVEKENNNGTKRGKLGLDIASPVFKPPVPSATTRKGPSPTSTTASTTRPTTVAKPVKPPPNRASSTKSAAVLRQTGPRRIPTDSAEAPQTKSRRG